MGKWVFSRPPQLQDRGQSLRGLFLTLTSLFQCSPLSWIDFSSSVLQHPEQAKQGACSSSSYTKSIIANTMADKTFKLNTGQQIPALGLGMLSAYVSGDSEAVAASRCS